MIGPCVTHQNQTDPCSYYNQNKQPNPHPFVITDPPSPFIIPLAHYHYPSPPNKNQTQSHKIIKPFPVLLLTHGPRSTIFDPPTHPHPYPKRALLPQPCHTLLLKHHHHLLPLLQHSTYPLSSTPLQNLPPSKYQLPKWIKIIFPPKCNQWTRLSLIIPMVKIEARKSPIEAQKPQRRSIKRKKKEAVVVVVFRLKQILV